MSVATITVRQKIANKRRGTSRNDENPTWKIQNGNLLDYVDSMSVEAMKCYRQNKKNYLSAGSDINGGYLQQSFDMPITPQYSGSSIERSAKRDSSPQRSESSFEHPGRRRTTLKREHGTRVLALTSMTFFVQMFSLDVWGPLFEPALTVFPRLSKDSLGTVPVWNAILSVLLVFPTSMSINYYGLKVCLWSSCLASTFGTGFRCLLFASDSAAFVIHTSASVLSSAVVAAKPLAVTVTSFYFRRGERNLATGTQIGASMAGTAAGHFLAAVLQRIPLHDPGSKTRWNAIMAYVMFGSFAMNVACTVFVYASFPPPDATAQVSEQTVAKSRVFNPLKISMREIVRNNTNLLFVALSYACSNAFSWPWFRLLDVTYDQVGFPPYVGVQCRFALILNACLLTLVVCWLTDRQHPAELKKAFGTAFLGLSTVIMLLVVLTLTVRGLRENTTTLVTGVFYAFPLSWATRSLLMELAADNADPVPETLAVGLVEVIKVICEIVVYLFVMNVSKHNLAWLHVSTFIGGLLGLVFLAFVKTKHRRY